MIFSSPWPSLEPYAPLSVPQLMEATVRRLPDKPALMTADGAACTYAEVWAAVRGMARALQDRGIAKGDMIAIFAPNSVEYAIVLHGALLAGAVVTTLNSLYREREVEHQLHDAGAKMVFTLSQLKGIVDAAKPKLPQLRDVVEMEGVWEMARLLPTRRWIRTLRMAIRRPARSSWVS